MQYSLEKPNICDFEGILKTECNLHNLNRNFRVGRAGLLNVKRATFKCEGEMNGQMLHYEQVFGNVFEMRDNKFCTVLMKYRQKVKGEQVIILQMDQQLKTKNISHVSGQLFCCQ